MLYFYCNATYQTSYHIWQQQSTCPSLQMNNGPFQSYLASKAASDGTTHSKVTTFQKKTSDITIDIKHLANYFP